MGTYLLRRCIGLLPVLFVISLITFATTALVPGDATSVLLGPTATPERVAEVQERFGLDQPLPIQYAKWIGQVIQGNLGNSILNKQPVLSMVWAALRVTLELLILSMAFAVTLALILGILAAIFQGTWKDRMIMTFALVGTSVPTFWLGLLLIQLFAVRLQILPPSGYVPFSEDPVQNLRSMVLPAFSLGIYLAGPLTRFIRSSLVETLHQQFITTARSKGLRELRIIRTHALKNALIPSITFAGLQIGALIGGAIVTEVVFSLPGTGSLALNGILNRDFPVVQGVVLVVACGYVLINIFVDILYVFLDPRIKLTEAL